MDFIKTKTPYLTDGLQYTFVGTRTGGSAAAAWAVFNFLGMDGFKKIVGDCMEITKFLAVSLKKSGFELVVDPMLNILAFRGSNSKLMAQRLRDFGWWVSYVPRLDCIRIVLMPHVRKKHALAFLKDLSKLA